MKKNKTRLGLVIKIDDETEIWADSMQYSIRKKQLERKCWENYAYFGTLEDCFSDIFKEKVRYRLTKNKKKDMEEVIKIHKEVQEWLKTMFKGLESGI